MIETQKHNRWTSARLNARARRDAKNARTVLANELAVFDSPADLIELAAMLERYDDKHTEPIRRMVDWSRAA